ncbi:AAA family ATPase [Ruminiclostridium herbifermentans]|uniref:AAA family ATPase n=1 Tax=Ruminiclostridium herbifermentans TaxID=2488810 RepID=A0A4U7JEG1_9FIRM|nr:AAA family ATPase [Ruminiclostridium herbifermentans]QNU67801.1 AAA family ATPase [Ruminiclostridium herbifermentans]
MKIILVSNSMHDIFVKFISSKFDIINKNDKLSLSEVNDYLENVKPIVDGIVIIDQVFFQWDETDKLTFSLLADNINNAKILIFTTDFKKQFLLENYIKSDNIKVVTIDYIRLSQNILNREMEYLINLSQRTKPLENISKDSQHNIKKVNTEKKRSFFDRFKSSHKDENKYNPTDQLERDFESISKGISRVISITGHRGSGLTSTSINLACEASKRGLKAIVIDLDIDYRGCNAYFSNFNEASNKNEEMNASLIRTLAKPQDYKTSCFCVNENFWVTSLGYSFNDKRLIEHFYNSTKLVGLLSLLRSKFNVIILDMPLDLLKVFEDAIIHIDVFGLCVPNSIYGILSTLRNIEVVLNNESISYVNSKSKVVVTKYNDRAKFQEEYFVPEKVCEIMTSGISSNFRNEINLAGYIPYSFEFDKQIESDIPIVNSSTEYEKNYGNILLRLMEGVK